jgi:hypothetical protein
LDGEILGTGHSFRRANLPIGSHTLTLTVTDSDGNKATDQIAITINPSATPTATITSPVDGQKFAQGEMIYFAGSAEDPEDGALPDSSLTWSSSRDRFLGTGSSISTKKLSVGTHAITLSAVDSTGVTGTAQINIVIEPSMPTASISSPTSGQEFFFRKKVDLAGIGTDPHDGVLPGKSLVWYSSIDGLLGTGNTLSRSDLSPGMHTIALTVTDSHGNKDGTQVDIKVHPPYPPSASITSPTSGKVSSYGDVVNFAGSATDPEDGALTGTSLVWTSSRDGFLGTGTSFSKSDLSVGIHTITLKATDSMGLNNSVQVTITINPVAKITSPTEGDIFSEEESITLTGQALGLGRSDL